MLYNSAFHYLQTPHLNIQLNISQLRAFIKHRKKFLCLLKNYKGKSNLRHEPHLFVIFLAIYIENKNRDSANFEYK